MEGVIPARIRSLECSWENVGSKDCDEEVSKEKGTLGS